MRAGPHTAAAWLARIRGSGIRWVPDQHIMIAADPQHAQQAPPPQQPHLAATQQPHLTATTDTLSSWRSEA